MTNPICRSSEKIDPRTVAKFVIARVDDDLPRLGSHEYWRHWRGDEVGEDDDGFKNRWTAGRCDILEFLPGYGPDGPVARKLAAGWVGNGSTGRECRSCGSTPTPYGTADGRYWDACESCAESMGVFEPEPSKPCGVEGCGTHGFCSQSCADRAQTKVVQPMPWPHVARAKALPPTVRCEAWCGMNFIERGVPNRKTCGSSGTETEAPFLRVDYGADQRAFCTRECRDRAAGRTPADGGLVLAPAASSTVAAPAGESATWVAPSDNGYRTPELARWGSLVRTLPSSGIETANAHHRPRWRLDYDMSLSVDVELVGHDV